MLDGFGVALSPLLLEDELHVAFRVLYYSRLDLDSAFGDSWVAAQSVFPGAELVDFVEGENVADFDITEAGYGERVAWGEDVFPARERGDDVL